MIININIEINFYFISYIYNTCFGSFLKYIYIYKNQYIYTFLIYIAYIYCIKKIKKK